MYFESFENFFIHCNPNRFDKLVFAITLKKISFSYQTKILGVTL